MAKKPNIHTTHSNQDDKWRNISEGASRAIKLYDTKAKAQADGREIARERGVEHLIHNENGQIAQRNSYGHDPRKVQG
jgi:IS5 family transposase